MRKAIAIFSVLCLGLILVAISHARQAKASPPATATLDLGGGQSITIDYSSPRAKGRTIFGGLVPYGKVWRAGANSATTFVNTVDVTVGSANVPTGHYTVFAIPEENKWTLIISKKTGEWGIPYPGESEDLARTDMKVSKLSSPVEDFTISFDKAPKGGVLNMEWENTRASVPIMKK
jgi:Protein of unknown function (DUF2911)